MASQSEIERRHLLSKEIERIENARNPAKPILTLKEARSLKKELETGPAWSGSRSGVVASFLNLFQDEKTNKSYLSYKNIKLRVNNLMAWAASRMTPKQASLFGVSGFQGLSPKATEEAVRTGSRLLRPGGGVMETIRETPEPLAEEVARRGAQAKEVGQSLLKEVSPVLAKQKEELEKRGILNPILLGTSAALLVLMKNKTLALITIGGIVYLVKSKEIKGIVNKAEGLT